MMLNMGQTTQVTLPDMQESPATGKYNGIWSSEGTRNRKRAALNKAEKLFRHVGGFADPTEMPTTRVEVEFFCHQSVFGKVLPRKVGLKTEKQKTAWRDEFCTICDVASGRRAFENSIRERQDDFQKLLDLLAGTAPGTEILSAYELINLRSLVRECRVKGISIPTLTAAAFNEMASDLAPQTQAALAKAVTELHALRSSNRIPAHLSPQVAPDEMRIEIQPTRRVTPAIHPEFQALMDQYLRIKVEGTNVRSFGTEERTLKFNGVGEAREHNIRESLKWFWHGMVALGLASSTESDSEALRDPVLIQDVIDACAGGRLGPNCTTDTRRARVNSSLGFLEWFAAG